MILARERDEGTPVPASNMVLSESIRGQDYLLGFVFPNFYFHLTTAYNILRHSGVAVGKMDLLAT